jgi:hypothetical protein
VSPADAGSSGDIDDLLALPLRNPNLANPAIAWLAIAGVVLIVGRTALPVLGWAIVALFVGAGAIPLVSWRRVTVRCEDSGITVSGITRSRFVPWRAIDHFEIRPPHRRTPFMLSFTWWLDQAAVVLRDGERIRLRAIQPRHGWTVLTYFRIIRRTPADEIVDRLNWLTRPR